MKEVEHKMNEFNDWITLGIFITFWAIVSKIIFKDYFATGLLLALALVPVILGIPALLKEED